MAAVLGSGSPPLPTGDVSGSAIEASNLSAFIALAMDHTHETS